MHSPLMFGIFFLVWLPKNKDIESKGRSILIDLAKLRSKSYVPFPV